MTTDLAIPTVHLNGTSQQQLIKDLCEAVRALRQAKYALSGACPNGRDYYPQGPGAIGRALDQHEARHAKLHEIIKELETIAEAVADQDDARCALCGEKVLQKAKGTNK